MAVESACIPVPSEIIMPLAGWFLVQAKGHGFEWVLLAGALGALGNTIGSVVAYYAGAAGGRPLLERYGRFLLITRHDLDRADAFFARRGPLAVCISRVLPVVRTFISFPAGVARMRFDLFVVLTFLGSFVWSLALAWGGYALGQHWQRISNAIRPFDYPIAALIVFGIAWFIWRHVRRDRTPPAPVTAPAAPRGDEGSRRAP
ncbi:MAG TPA: DedA family protein [Dehalococcoidia bacterium]|nr:DedA family protein [Dehalococcoidia bacterium]